MIRKTLNTVALSAALCLSALPSQALETVVYQLDWLPGGDKAPVYVAQQKGFFKELGLEVKIAQGKGSTDAITKIAAGHADVGRSDIVALLAAKASNTIPVTGVMNVFSEAPYAFFTVKGRGVESIQDLAEKTVASSPFTSSNLFFPYVVTKNGLEESGIRHVKANPGSLAPMLLHGRTDAITSWVTDTVTIQTEAEKIGLQVNIFPWYGAGLNIYSSSVIANDQFLKDRPDVAKRFLQALKKGMIYTWQHPEEAGEMVHQVVPEVDPVVAANTIMSIRQLVHNPSSEAHGLGNFEKNKLAETWRLIALAQDIDPAKLDPESAISRDFVEAN
ncbi:hypothetical protein DXV75_01855 [Alteromonas aestuariivivens]|uniref:Thiamine pyrimidine synthase n=1 Tax=Alteromonas aestuariivivens TaxID=1938339 RepID=A0A3D8MG80_9ALTE|nr:ABC transporter substrate-binding protein [Alteromonas aestuariivivens]RDV29228.1 hypothetical protein DXV75_01855 [Alteromonas aestuariivivens]